MWVLDTGRIGFTQICNAKLLVFDLNTDRLLEKHEIPRNISENEEGKGVLVSPIVETHGPSCKTKTVRINSNSITISYKSSTNNHVPSLASKESKPSNPRLKVIALPGIHGGLGGLRPDNPERGEFRTPRGPGIRACGFRDALRNFWRIVQPARRHSSDGPRAARATPPGVRAPCLAQLVQLRARQIGAARSETEEAADRDQVGEERETAVRRPGR